jgi:hypothetical protein
VPDTQLPPPRRRPKRAMTMLSVLRDVLEVDPETGKTQLQNPRSVVHGLAIHPAPTKPGLHLLTPAQLAGLCIDEARITGDGAAGYQRALRPRHARTIARRLAEGEPFPPILYAVDEDYPEVAEIIDGQHRAAGGIIAREPVWAVCFEATPAERRKLFAGQAKAAKVDRNTLLLSGDQPWHVYLQRALADSSHPWAPIVSKNGWGHTLAISQAYDLMVRFVTRMQHHGPSISDEVLRERWNELRANLLPELLLAVGTRQANPHAWSSKSLRALVATANRCVNDLDTIQRWRERMPLFDYAGYRSLSSVEMADRMLDHWNRGLKRADQITREAA